ncbi:hypothetical protein COY07_00165 [Candidatus Peregrinibacteria bacterium CG_4_10_14_0_2_um_filter_43_11]|nr:MAG: hypothetical protein COY07_00165 [Candidatus Peregrinibacteria bacterium CG_4_10_14_0_2_um_filter_43_11]
MLPLSDKILAKIKEKKLTPKSRLHFIALHILVWTSVLVSIVLGGIAIAIILRHLLSADWELARRFSGGPVQSFFLLLPYIWFLFIGITLFSANLLFSHTKKGYRFHPVLVVGISIIISLVLGGVFYEVKLDNPIEDHLQKNIPPYAQWHENRRKMFVAPEKGVLAGRISKIIPAESLVIIDFKKAQWTVDIRTAEMELKMPLNVDMHVGVIGEKTGDYTFKAYQIRPFPGPRRPAPRPF